MNTGSEAGRWTFQGNGHRGPGSVCNKGYFHDEEGKRRGGLQGTKFGAAIFMELGLWRHEIPDRDKAFLVADIRASKLRGSLDDSSLAKALAVATKLYSLEQGFGVDLSEDLGLAII